MLEPGTPAPDFILADQAGARIRLHAFRGKPVVLFFYPRDNSRGCTAQACAFRNSHADIRAAGAVVLGISQQDTESHQKFASDHDLPYRLLTDEGGKVAKLYSVPPFLGFMPGRATYVIDAEGTIRWGWSAMLATSAHAEKALEALRAL